MRLDARLVAAGRISSRSRAADLIKRGLVTLDGKTLKASDKISNEAFARLDIQDHPWVSRAALKLVEALKQLAHCKFRHSHNECPFLVPVMSSVGLGIQ